jgi:ABC-type nitrate/sulfonate/bicarbonate transport system ATPase subunit
MPGAVIEISIEAKRVALPGKGMRTVLSDVRFTAGRGEFLALLGPSGIGKTTALRIALGLDNDFLGAVSRRAERLAAVFQEPRLLPWLSIAENLRLVMTDRARVADIAALLRTVELPDAEQRRPLELSLGMARRAALARALAAEPDLLVLDEPFASLDPALAARLVAVVSRWARQRGATVLLATHDLDQALGMADRVLVLVGEPATLAADIAVPERSDPGAIADLRAGLVTRFPFLANAEAIA